MRSLFFFTAILLFISPVLAQNVLAKEEFDAENVRAVTIEGRFCDVYVQSGPKVHFKGIIEGRGEEGDYEILSKIENDELKIEVERRRQGRNRSWGWNNNTRTKLELTIPDGTLLKVDNTSGDLKIVGVNTSEIIIDLTSGDLEMDRVKAKVDIESTSGDLQIDDLEGDLITYSTSGDQEIDNVKGNISVRASSGDIELNGFLGDLEVKTTSGEIYAKRGKGAMAFRSTSGNIDGYGLELTDDLLLRASSGDIEIELVNDISTLNFDLETSSGDLDVGRRSSDKDMYIKEGEDFIWVKGQTTSGNMDFRN